VLVRTVIRVCVPIEARPSLAPVMTQSTELKPDGLELMS
jgi:hypothetical protein